MKLATRNSQLAIVFMAIMIFALTACGPSSFVKPTQITKDTAETVLYEARTMQNKGIITASQFYTVRTAYDALKVAQDTVIDARIAYLTDGSQTKMAILNAALAAVSKELANLTKVATDLGIIGGN